MIHAFALYAGALGLGLAALAAIDDYLLARIFGPLALVLAAFFVEHFVGLGGLAWAGPALALAVAAVLWRRRSATWEAILENRDVEAACAVGFLWALSWRWEFPDIDAVSEKMTSLVMVTAFGAGERLPPLDPWLPPERLNVYYPLQHYGAGLAKRLLHIEPTFAINLSFCLLVGWISAVAWAAVARRVRSNLSRAACLTSLALGGTGAALAVPLMTKTVSWPTAVVRFIGEWGGSPPEPTGLGRLLAQGKDAAHLPVETLSYYMALGDFHPPWGGWLLLALGLYAAGKAVDAADEGSRERYLGAALATVPLSAAVNAWCAPMQALAIAMFVSPLAREFSVWRRPQAWAPPLVAAAALAPFLAGFVGGAAGRNHLRWVARADRATVSAWLLTFWPLAAILGAGLLAPERNARRSALAWTALLLFAELFFMDDLYSHPFNRFNSYMKWMPWLLVGATLDLAPRALESGGRAARAAVLIALLAPCAFAASLGRHKAQWEKPHPGRLEGHAWLTDDPGSKAVLDRLREEPGGLTIEYPPAMSYTSQSALSLLSGHATYIGWPNHEVTWRGPRDDIWKRYNDARSLYHGEMADPAAWLREKGIRLVVWLPSRDRERASFEALNAKLSSGFAWREAYRSDAGPAGFWSLR